MLIGNVGTDPEVRYVDEGVAVARFSFATTEKGYTLQKYVTEIWADNMEMLSPKESKE